MIRVAVHGLVIEPIWNTAPGVTATWVDVLSTPCAARICSPPAHRPKTAPGARSATACSASRAPQCPARSVFVIGGRLTLDPAQESVSDRGGAVRAVAAALAASRAGGGG